MPVSPPFPKKGGPNTCTAIYLAVLILSPNVMPVRSSARSSLAPLVLLLAMRHGQGLVPQSKQAWRVFSTVSSPPTGTTQQQQQQACHTTQHTGRPAPATPGEGSRTVSRALLGASAAAADGNAAEDVRKVSEWKIRNTAIF